MRAAQREEKQNGGNKQDTEKTQNDTKDTAKTTLGKQSTQHTKRDPLKGG